MESAAKFEKNQFESTTSKTSIVSGIITGQLAGLIMAVAVMAVFVIFYGKSPLYPVQVIGSTVFGAEALKGFHFGALIAGLLLHQLGPSLAWSILFGLIARSLDIRSVGGSLLVGAIIGVISMVDVYVIVPMIMKSLHGVDFWNQEIPMGWDWVAHLVFGLSFGLYPTVTQKLEN